MPVRYFRLQLPIHAPCARLVRSVPCCPPRTNSSNLSQEWGCVGWQPDTGKASIAPRWGILPMCPQPFVWRHHAFIIHTCASRRSPRTPVQFELTITLVFNSGQTVSIDLILWFFSRFVFFVFRFCCRRQGKYAKTSVFVSPGR